MYKVKAVEKSYDEVRRKGIPIWRHVHKNYYEPFTDNSPGDALSDLYIERKYWETNPFKKAVPFKPKKGKVVDIKKNKKIEV